MHNQPKKSLGQHWLVDTDILNSIAQQANLSNKDTVLEVGPGLGALTKILVSKAGQVIAVEKDERLAEYLNDNLKAGNLKVYQQDILSFDLTEVGKSYKVVANIPYYLTSKLIKTLLTANNSPELIILLVQKEVAERVAAEPGAMSLLSVSAQYYGFVELGVKVSPQSFDPAPKVWSQVIIITPHKHSDLPLPTNQEKDFFKLVKAGFSNRRKKLKNSLAGGLGITVKEVVSVLESVAIDPDSRAQELSVGDWLKIYNYIREV